MSRKFANSAYDRLSWIELNLQNFEHNWNVIRNCIGPHTHIIAMVKGNGYGHGAVEISKKAEALGAAIIGVVSLGEARELREAGISTPILIANYIDPASVPTALSFDATLTVMDAEIIKAIEEAAEKQGKKVRVHLKIDTGMHRAGAMPEDVLALARQIHTSANVIFEGIFTHFAVSDEKDPSFTYTQLEVFNRCLDEIEAAGIPLPKYIHASNSGAVLQIPEAHKNDPKKRLNAVRPGLILYGLLTGIEPSNVHLRPVLEVKAKLVQVREIPPGDTVGYGRTFTAKKKTVVGLVPIGYADGLPRAFSNKGYMLIKGKKAPILGRVSMDQTSIDLTDIPEALMHDEIVILGYQGDEHISAETLAKAIDTIPYEITVRLHATRLPRRVIKE